jgi:hypothetical protein
MIDAALLKQLGWREDLIEEVTRVAESLRKTYPEPRSVATPHDVPHYASGQELFIHLNALPDVPILKRGPTKRPSQRRRRYSP